MAKLRGFTSAAARSPWSWALVPLVAVAVVGQWGGMTAAEVVAAAFAAVGIGIAIGLASSVGRGAARRSFKTPSGGESAKAPSSGVSPEEMSAKRDARPPRPNSPRIVDLRGARLTNTMLVRADLRKADLRGATLTGADLSDADLTDARLGPLDDDVQSDNPA